MNSDSRVEHNWELKIALVNIGPLVRPSILAGAGPAPRSRKYWKCTNCDAMVYPTENQLKSNSFGKPSRKRKVNGLYCGESIINKICES